MEENVNYIDSLMEKWGPVLDFDGLAPITDLHRKQTTAVLLENQNADNLGVLKRDPQMSLTSLLTEAAPTNAMGASSSTASDGAIDIYDPVLISLVRRSMPNLMAYDLCGVQPMTGPTGLIFAFRSRYSTQGGVEALFNEANTTFAASAAGNTASATASNNQVGSDPSLLVGGNNALYTLGKAMSTAAAEALGDGASNQFQEMAISIEKISVTAKSRAIKAEYSHEIAQDLKSVHSLDIETELAGILSGEVLAEINREVIRSIYTTATIGAQLNTANAGYFDLDVDSNGRWMEEKFKGLLFQINREANAIAKATRSGKGNWVVVPSDVADALNMIGVLKAQDSGALNVDDTGNTFVGTINGGMRVYIDPYFDSSAGDHFVAVGRKGASQFDAGLFYAPYVPLQMYRATGQDTFQPKIGFKTRYGMVAHPFATAAADGVVSAANKNKWFRLFAVKNLI